MEEKTTPLRKRMIEDMNIRSIGDKAQKAHIVNRRSNLGLNQSWCIS